MRIYTLYIEDDRYSVPTLLTAEFADDARVIAHTAEILARSVHYMAVDVWDGDRKVGRAPRSQQAS